MNEEWRRAGVTIVQFKSIWSFWLLLLECIAALSIAQAAQAQLYYGGYGYQTYFSEISDEFPYISSILSGETGVQFERQLYNQLPDITMGGTPVLKDGLATLAEKPLVFSLVFTSETVHSEQIASSYKLLVVLNAQILIFDFNRSEIVASFPVSARFIDVLTEPPGEKDIASLVDQALSSGSDASISSQFLTKVTAISEPAISARMVRVTNVNIADETLNTLQKSSNPDAFRRRLADEFSARLSTNQKIAVLPANVSQAINNSMAARMADGTVYNITIPDADYNIDISIDGLKKVEYATNNIGTTYVYGVFASFKFHEPHSGHVFFDEKLKLGQPQSIPKTAVVEGDSLAFVETIDKLFDEFTFEIGQNNNQWAEAHIYSAKAPRQSMKKLDALMEACR